MGRDGEKPVLKIMMKKQKLVKAWIKQDCRVLLEKIRDGHITVDQGLDRLKGFPFEKLEYATVGSS